jgi:hypothetical protein
MSTADQELLSAFDGHETESVRAALDAGADACSTIRGKLPVYWLLEEYTRSDRLGDCLRLLFERGAVLDDPIVAPVLLNDADAIRAAVRADPSLLEHRTTLTSSFTPLVGATLLHVAAEYGNLDAARAGRSGRRRQRDGGRRRIWPQRSHSHFPHRELEPEPIRADHAPPSGRRRQARRASRRDHVGPGLRVGDAFL